MALRRGDCGWVPLRRTAIWNRCFLELPWLSQLLIPACLSKVSGKDFGGVVFEGNYLQVGPPSEHANFD